MKGSRPRESKEEKIADWNNFLDKREQVLSGFKSLVFLILSRQMKKKSSVC